jgi:TonB family protein
VNVEVDENGRVTGVSLVGSSGNAALDQAVLETVREQYEFEGVGTGGATIPVEVDMTLEGSDLNRRARERGDRTSIETPASAPEPIESTATEPAVAPTEAIPKPTSVSPPAAPVPTPEPASAIAEPTPSLSPSEPVLEETPAASPEQVSPVEPDPSVSENDSEPLLPAATPLPEALAEPDHAAPLPASSSTESIDLPPSAPAAIPSESPIPSAPPE